MGKLQHSNSDFQVIHLKPVIGVWESNQHNWTEERLLAKYDGATLGEHGKRLESSLLDTVNIGNLFQRDWVEFDITSPERNVADKLTNILDDSHWK